MSSRMTRFLDARVPVVFAGVPSLGDAVLAPERGVMHPAGCACCIERSPIAVAFDRLFLDRVRGAVPWFNRVIAPDDPAVRDAVLNDPVVSARFRLG